MRPSTLPLDTVLGERWISISGVEFFGGTVYALRDITEEHRLDELKAEFIATASHELRTPLAAVYGAAQTLSRHDFALDEAGRARFISLIVDESDRLATIVNQILLANQLEVGRVDLETEPFDGADMVERVVESAKTHAPSDITFDVRVAEGVPPVAADKDRARQVLVNLVENAVKYSPGGGTIEVGLEAADRSVRFSVVDEGMGIPSHEQARIFEKFYRLDPNLTSRNRRNRPRALHLQRARRAHGREHLARVGGGQGLDVLLPAPEHNGSTGDTAEARRERAGRRLDLTGRDSVDEHCVVPGSRRAGVRPVVTALVLAVPVVEPRPGPSQQDLLALRAASSDLAAIDLLHDLRRDLGREHQDADRRVGAVADLVGAVLAPTKAHDVTFPQRLLALLGAQRRLSAQDDEPLLVRVVQVVRAEPIARVKLVHRRAQQLSPDVPADKGVPAAPALTLLGAVPLVAVQVEDLHAKERRRSAARTPGVSATQ